MDFELTSKFKILVESGLRPSERLDIKKGRRS